jgi:hypothetical protein
MHAGVQSSISCTACQLLGSVIHFLWLTVFSWTGNFNLLAVVLDSWSRHDNQNHHWCTKFCGCVTNTNHFNKCRYCLPACNILLAGMWWHSGQVQRAEESRIFGNFSLWVTLRTNALQCCRLLGRSAGQFCDTVTWYSGQNAWWRVLYLSGCKTGEQGYRKLLYKSMTSRRQNKLK